MNKKLRTEKEVDEYYISNGLLSREEVIKINNEIKRMEEYITKAIINVKRKKFLNGLFYRYCDGCELKDEVQLELNKILEEST